MEKTAVYLTVVDDVCVNFVSILMVLLPPPPQALIKLKKDPFACTSTSFVLLDW